MPCAADRLSRLYEYLKTYASPSMYLLPSAYYSPTETFQSITILGIEHSAATYSDSEPPQDREPQQSLSDITYQKLQQTR